MNTQVRVNGWKKYYSDSNYKVYYNEDYTSLTLTISGLYPTTSHAQIGTTYLVPSELRPESNHMFHDVNHVMSFYVANDTGILYLRSITGNNLSNQRAFCTTMWKHTLLTSPL